MSTQATLAVYFTVNLSTYNPSFTVNLSTYNPSFTVNLSTYVFSRR